MKRELHDGHVIPQLGFGTFRLAPGAATRAAVDTALTAGYRHIDTASVYGNEADVGAAIRASGLPRDEVFVTTKLWNDDQGVATTRDACLRSLDALGLEYIDLYLLHWPHEQRLASWTVLEQLREEGIVRSIGVSNFLEHHLDELIATDTEPPVVNQLEMSPFLYQTRAAARAACDHHGVVLEAYSPLTKGHRLQHPAIVDISEQLECTPAQVLLRWGMQHGFVVLPRSSNPERIASNALALDIELTARHMELLDSLDEGLVTGWDPASAQ